MSIEVHYQSVETFHVPCIDVHPTTGPVVLSASSVDVAMPAVGASPTSWVSTTWASGTYRQGDLRWYMAVLDLSDFTLAAGTTYQPWVRIGGSGGSILKATDTIKAINT